jgi:methanethiol S-methyltransferase
MIATSHPLPVGLVSQAMSLATNGSYSYVRHPQYVGFILVMSGFLFQWPTLLTLAMFPVLVFMCVRLARSEEREALVKFGGDYERNMREVPGFVPRLGALTGGPRHGRVGERPTNKPSKEPKTKEW